MFMWGDEELVSTPHGGLATVYCIILEDGFEIVSTPHGGLATFDLSFLLFSLLAFQLHTVD